GAPGAGVRRRHHGAVPVRDHAAQPGAPRPLGRERPAWRRDRVPAGRRAVVPTVDPAQGGAVGADPAAARQHGPAPAGAGARGRDRPTAVLHVPHPFRNHQPPAARRDRRRGGTGKAQALMLLGPALFVSAALFTLGVFGVLLRRNAIVIFMCVELMLHAVNLTFVALAQRVLAFAVAAAAVTDFATLHPAAPLVFRYWEWMPVGDLRLDFALQFDQLAAVMALVVTGVGALIHLFSVGYMHKDPGYARYFAYLNLFVFFMLLLVLGASFPVMFVGWEGVGLCSYLLIGFWFNEQINADAGKKAFIVNRIGDFGFLVAMLLIFHTTGSLDFTQVFARAQAVFPPAGATVTAITLFLFLGCTGKSAQIPLFTWLPDAMQGPTPVSALIHAATMVTAGVYLVARCNV